MQVIVFIGLKTLEIGAICLAIYLCRWLGVFTLSLLTGYSINNISNNNTTLEERAVQGVTGMAVLTSLIGLGIIICIVITTNWQWAENIIRGL